MKYLILSFFLWMTCLDVEAQYVTFEDTIYEKAIIIDTNNSQNIWQIGRTQKQIFDTAWSGSNVIITDTVNPYPVNDTSLFYFWYYNGYHDLHWPELGFRFKIDSDSLNDYGFVEVSPDDGVTWLNVFSSEFSASISNDLVGWEPNHDSPFPFTGTSKEWQEFFWMAGGWNQKYGSHDSILFRFGFVSDSIQSNKEGWMIDNIWGMSMFSSVEEVANQKGFKIFPNPSYGRVELRFEKGLPSLGFLINSQGVVLKAISRNDLFNTLDISYLPNGLYFLSLDFEGDRVTQAFFKR